MRFRSSNGSVSRSKSSDFPDRRWISLRFPVKTVVELGRPELGHHLIVAATETNTDDDMDRFARALAEVL